MARLIFGLLLLGTIFAQASMLPRWNPYAVSPNVVVVLLLVWTMLRGPHEGILWVFTGGVVLDILSFDLLGSNGLALIIVVLLAGVARRQIFHSNLILPIGVVIVATLVQGVVLALLRSQLPDTRLAIQAMLHAALLPFVYYYLRWLVAGEMIEAH